MARSTKLKVYRTAIGFHDAYVAAPSRKAALKAWGSEKDLFARGAADLVTDAALMAAPLAAPGTVVKRLRGTVAEQIAALPADRPKPKPRKNAEPRPSPAPANAPPKPKPRPSRRVLDAAEAKLEAAERTQADEREGLARKEAALREERRRLERAQGEAMNRLRQARDHAEVGYRRALDAWKA